MKFVMCFCALAVISALTATIQAQTFADKTHFRFDFGIGKAASGYTKILPSTIYNRESGYGFEPGTPVLSIKHHTRDVLRSDFITSDTPFFFSVALPEGNYDVKVTFGNARGVSDTTVKAELRRLMV